MPNHVSAFCGTWRVLPEGMSQMFRLLYLGNGWADCVVDSVHYWVFTCRRSIINTNTNTNTNLACTWEPISYSLCSSYGWGISARAHVQRYPHTALLYLGNGLVDCVQIWYVGSGSLTKCLPQVMDGVHLHVRTCAPLFHKCSPCCFSVTAEPIALKFGMHLVTH